MSLDLEISHNILIVLVNYLRVHVKPMFHLYSILKDRAEPPTPEEIEIACAKRGSAVAVERIFSGGRDTISLLRARLQPDTIRTLMLVKKRLHLKNARAKAAQAARPFRR
jgi:hypothetical protein